VFGKGEKVGQTTDPGQEGETKKETTCTRRERCDAGREDVPLKSTLIDWGKLPGGGGKGGNTKAIGNGRHGLNCLVLPTRKGNVETGSEK